MFRLDSLILSSPKPEPFFSFLLFYFFSFSFLFSLFFLFLFLSFFFSFSTERRNCLFVHEGDLKSIGLIRDVQQFALLTDTRLTDLSTFLFADGFSLTGPCQQLQKPSKGRYGQFSFPQRKLVYFALN